jgi:chemotaxis response regulator CheB
LNKKQVLGEVASAGPTLYLVGDVTFTKPGLPSDLLNLWAKRRCKVVFLTSNSELPVQATIVSSVDLEPRAIFPEGVAQSPEVVARKLLQFEPAPQTRCRITRPVIARPAGQGAAKAPPDIAPKTMSRRTTVIGIGASTGGVEALQVVLRDLPSSLPPIVIVQHTRSAGRNGLVQVLNRATDIDVVAAEQNVPLMPGRAYVACGRSHHLRLSRTNMLRAQLVEAPSVSGHRPSVNVMFDSLSELGNQVAAVLLTGMGNDGASGLKRIRDRGGWTAAQDERSSVVYGMPKAAAEAGAAKEQLSLGKVAQRLIEISQR